MARQRNREIIPKFRLTSTGILSMTFYHKDLAPAGRTTGRFAMSLGIKVDPFMWEQKERKPGKPISRAGRKEDYDFIKETLETWRGYTKTIFDHFHAIGLTATDENITKAFEKLKMGHSLDSTVDSFLTLSAFIKSWIEDESKHFYGQGRPYKKASIGNKKQAYKALSGFCSDRYHVDFRDISLKFHTDFIEYMRKEMDYSDNQIGKMVKEIKFFLREAETEGYTVPAIYKSSKFYCLGGPASDEDAIAIDLEDLLEVHRMTVSDQQKVYKDWFILGCFTGLRVEDLLSLNSANIIKIKGADWIKKKTGKTGEYVFIKVSPIIRSILSQYDGFPPAITSVHLNLNIKKIFKQAEYENWPKVKSHCMRRSFCTNAYFSTEFPQVERIMAVSGHKKLASFLLYIRVSPKEHAIRLQETAFFEDVSPLQISRSAK